MHNTGDPRKPSLLKGNQPSNANSSSNAGTSILASVDGKSGKRGASTHKQHPYTTKPQQAIVAKPRSGSKWVWATLPLLACILGIGWWKIQSGKNTIDPANENTVHVARASTSNHPIEQTVASLPQPEAELTETEMQGARIEGAEDGNSSTGISPFTTLEAESSKSGNLPPSPFEALGNKQRLAAAGSAQPKSVVATNKANIKQPIPPTGSAPTATVAIPPKVATAPAKVTAQETAISKSTSAMPAAPVASAAVPFPTVATAKSPPLSAGIDPVPSTTEISTPAPLQTKTSAASSAAATPQLPASSSNASNPQPSSTVVATTPSQPSHTASATDNSGRTPVASRKKPAHSPKKPDPDVTLMRALIRHLESK